MANIDEWLGCVENPDFIRLFASGKKGGFGLERLKTCPSGFPRDFEHIQYLRMKDYCCWHDVDDHFFDDEDSLDKMAEIFKVAKPMMDFINAVVDDYE